MASVTIRMASSASDVEAVRGLCRDFVAWQLRTFPDLRDKILTYFEPVKWEAVLTDLPSIHARPKGGMLLALIDDAPVGCIMYREMAPGVAEAKRLFVDEGRRGLGIGRALVSEMLAAVAGDGYRSIRLDTARMLTAAIELYRAMGFHECAPLGDVPPELQDIAIFMERAL